MSKNAVIGKAARLNLPKRPSPLRRKGDPVIYQGAARLPAHALVLAPPAGEAPPRAPQRRPAAPRPPAPICSPAPAPAAPPVVAVPVKVDGEVAVVPLRPRERPLSLAAHAERETAAQKRCLWPSGEGPYEFKCGAPRLEPKPYCAEHCGIAYTTDDERKKARAKELADEKAADGLARMAARILEPEDDAA